MAWHDSLNQIQRNSIERLQIVYLNIRLGKDCPTKEDGHFDYERALSLCNLESLFSRREKRMLDCQTPDFPNSPVQPLIGKFGRLCMCVVVCLFVRLVVRHGGDSSDVTLAFEDALF